MEVVGEMINTLDEAAKPLANVSIVHLNGNTNAARVREVLSTLLTEGNSAPNSGTAKSANPPQNGQNRQRSQTQGNNQGGAAVRVVSPR
jgi:hypothetical protein